MKAAPGGWTLGEGGSHTEAGGRGAHIHRGRGEAGLTHGGEGQHGRGVISDLRASRAGREARGVGTGRRDTGLAWAVNKRWQFRSLPLAALRALQF